MKLRRLVCTLMILVLLCALCPVSRATSNTLVFSRETHLSTPTSRSVATVIKGDTFRNYLDAQLSHCPETVNLSHFNIPYSQANSSAIAAVIFYDLPLCFHVSTTYVTTSGTKIESLTPVYRGSTADYPARRAAAIAAADTLLSGIEGNGALSDVEKALLLHDRLGVWNEYDIPNLVANTLPYDVYTAYGAFVTRSSVCQGYAMAYMYLLDRVGIDNEYCSSDALDHGWNIVYIDNVPYHVDVTHNDNRYLDGHIGHQYFLVSTDTYLARHNITGWSPDFTATPQDTRFEDMYWSDAESAFQLVDGTLYYIDNEAEILYARENGQSVEQCSVADRWYVSGGGYYPGQARLASCENELLFSGADGVYAYSPATDSTAKVWTPNGLSNTLSVYGFTYLEGKLIVNIANDANCVDTTLVNHKKYTTRSVNYPFCTEHTPSEIIEDTPASCGGTGLGHTVCTNCSALLQTNIIIPATEQHTPGAPTAKPSAAPTCSVGGLGEIHCSACTKLLQDNVSMEPTGIHNLRYIAVEPVTHTQTILQNGVRAHWQCEDCLARFASHTGGAPLSDPELVLVAEHRYAEKSNTVPFSPADCGRNAHFFFTCVCGKVGSETYEASGSATGRHLWDAGTVTKKPTLTASGKKTYTCLTCSKTKTETLPKTGVSTLTVFSDLKKSDWYVKNGAVDFVYNRGLFFGTSDTAFSPNEQMTRAMFVTVLGRLDGVKVKNNVSTPFADVKKGQYYTGYVKWANERGIVNGSTETTFSPDANINREQICAIMVRYCDYADIKLAKKNKAISFKDAAQISGYAKKAVASCQRGGVVNGEKKPDGYYFRPQGNATRAEVATIMMNFADNYLK